jgi:PAS domain-containing protein
MTLHASNPHSAIQAAPEVQADARPSQRPLLAVCLLVLLCLGLMTGLHQRWNTTLQHTLAPQDALEQARIRLLEAELVAERLRLRPDESDQKDLLARLDSALQASQDLDEQLQQDRPLLGDSRAAQQAASAYRTALQGLRDAARGAGQDKPDAAALLARQAEVDDRARAVELALHGKLAGDRRNQLVLTVGLQLALAALGVALILLLRQQAQRDRQALDALRDSESRLRAMAGALPDVSYLLDRSGLCVDVFGDVAKLPAPREQLLGRRMAGFLAPEFGAPFERTLQSAIDNATTCACSHTQTLGDGLHWFESRASALPGHALAVWVSQDVTERKRADQRAQDLTRLYGLHSQVNQAIVWTDGEHELFERICDAAISHGHFQYAWVLRWPADAGVSEPALAQSGDAALAGLARVLERQQDADQWVVRSLDQGVIQWQSGLALPGWPTPLDGVCLPLLDQGRYGCALVLVREGLDAANRDEQALLADIAMDLSYALTQRANAPAGKSRPQALSTTDAVLQD